MLVLFVLLGLVSLPFSLAWYDHQSLQHVRQAPSRLNPVPFDEAAADAVTSRPAARLAPSLFRLGGLMGLDSLGRSLLFRCLLGGVISLGIGMLASALSVTVGVLWGALAGLAGGKIDLVLMRIVDVLYGLPYILLVILLKVALDTPLTNLFANARISNVVILFVAIGATSWLTMARVVRAQVLSLKTQPFIEAARAFGAGPLAILRRHLLPNLVGPIAVYGSLIVPQAILSESFLSFLGIGIQRPVPTWGSLAAEGLQAVNTVVNSWWMLVFPCALLSLTLLALNFVGDALRDAFDPTTGSRT
jgi:oligopeptide transport system permease protein